ncbi:MAG TPA: biopolymer transporter ExbD, partial [Kofleriaceae bacterium]|nr:biopolymer transporter ExbD [Kofleriaceae bacterium]
MGEPMFADINITPLTDVFLVMVVIFMVSALAVQAERRTEKCKPPRAGIAVNPPTGRQRDVDPRQTTLVLELPSSGDTYIGGKRFTDGELDRVLRAAATNPQTQVVVRADRGIQLGRVVQVIERARTLGLDRLVIG